jgi:hypothetical protein
MLRYVSRLALTSLTGNPRRSYVDKLWHVPPSRGVMLKLLLNPRLAAYVVSPFDCGTLVWCISPLKMRLYCWTR